jgi:ABC-type nitrate/sulfonate/bicarbonate transport system substrate-binding protein
MRKRMKNHVSEIWYTVCPVPNASHFVVENGWFEEEFEGEGVRISHISELSAKDSRAHFSHQHPNLFRDGGCIPPIWGRSEGADTKVIGLIWPDVGQAILVGKDSLINNVADLRGKRLSLPKGLYNEIDFRRITVKRGFLMALKANGLGENDVQFVDINLEDLDTEVPERAQLTKSVQSTVGGSSSKKLPQQTEVDALNAGEVDAIFSYLGRELILENAGEARIIYHLNKHPDWRYKIQNVYPVVCTVNADLSESAPDLVKRWMKQLLRAGIWAKEHPAEARKVISAATLIPEEIIETSFPKNFHECLVPEISEKGVEALNIEKDFMLENGFISRDFDIIEWVDGRFIKEASADLGLE